MSQQNWNGYSLFTVDGHGGDSVELALSRNGYETLGDSGWHMLLCWHLGPERVVRTVDDIAVHTTQTSSARPGMETQTNVSARSESDQDIIEYEINEYLADAGVLPRPPGFVWHVKPPVGASSNELFRDILARERSAGAVHPSQTSTIMRAAVADFYLRR